MIASGLGSLGGLLHALAAAVAMSIGVFPSQSSMATQGATASPARAAANYYVGSSGAGHCSKSHTRRQARHRATPWCTISMAVSHVGPRARIFVAPGTYHELVQLTPQDDGVTLEGLGRSKPVITGDYVRATGINLVNGVRNVTIRGFEIQDMVSPPASRAVGILGLDTSHDTIENNVIHAIHGQGPYSYGVMLGDNNAPGLVHDVKVMANQIFDVGPGGESMGVWLLYTTRMDVEGNEIYLARKEGIRDWTGLDNLIAGNRLYLNWDGIGLEGSSGDVVTNNFVYANVLGFNPKHVADTASLATWRLPAPRWTRIVHNTAYANTHADIALGQDAPKQDYIAVEDNVFASPGDVHIHDFPAIRGYATILDGNVYSGDAPAYYANWAVPHVPLLQSLADLRSSLDWERHGQMFTPHFRDPAAGEFSFATSGMSPGVVLSDGRGGQLGATNLPPASMSWTRYTAHVVASTPEPPYLQPDEASDGHDDSIWWSNGYSTNASVTFDLGSAKPMNTFVLDLYKHLDSRSPKGYSIQVSTDNSKYTTVLSGSNPDSEGSSYKYTLASPVTARYVRLNLLSNFGASTVLFSDFGIGLLASNRAAS